MPNQAPSVMPFLNARETPVLLLQNPDGFAGEYLVRTRSWRDELRSAGPHVWFFEFELPRPFIFAKAPRPGKAHARHPYILHQEGWHPAYLSEAEPNRFFFQKGFARYCMLITSWFELSKVPAVSHWQRSWDPPGEGFSPPLVKLPTGERLAGHIPAVGQSGYVLEKLKPNTTPALRCDTCGKPLIVCAGKCHQERL